MTESVTLVLGAAAVVLVVVVAILIRQFRGLQSEMAQLESQTAQPGLTPPPASDPAAMQRLAALSGDPDPAQTSGAHRRKSRKSFDPGLVTKVEQGELPGLEQLEKALTKDPRNVELLEMLAYLYYCGKNLAKAIESYKRALIENPTNEVNHYYLANAYYLSKNAPQAIVHWTKVSEIAPESRYSPRAQERIQKVQEAGWVSVE